MDCTVYHSAPGGRRSVRATIRANVFVSERTQTLIRPSDESPPRERAQRFLDAGRYEQALECLREHLLICPEDAEALNDVGTILYSMGRFDEAGRHLSSALAFMARPRGQVMHNLAEAYLAAGRADDAMDLLNDLSDENALTADLLNRVTCALLEADDHDRAVETLHMSLRLPPGRNSLLPITETRSEPLETRPLDDLKRHFRILKELGDCYASLDDHASAANAYDQAARLLPDNPAPHVGMGVLAVQAKRFDDAVNAFDNALKRDRTCAEAFGGLAMVYQQTHNYNAAFDMYLRCLELDTDNLVALLGLFQTSCRMGTFSQIIRYLRLFLDRHPGDTAVLFCLASLYVKEGLFTLARDALLAVLAL